VWQSCELLYTCYFLTYLLTYLLVGYTGVVAYSKAAEAGESYSDTMRKALDRVTCDKLRDRSNNCSDNRTCIGQRLLIGRLSIYLAELKKGKGSPVVLDPRNGRLGSYWSNGGPWPRPLPLIGQPLTPRPRPPSHCSPTPQATSSRARPYPAL